MVFALAISLLAEKLSPKELCYNAVIVSRLLFAHVCITSHPHPQ